MGHNVPVTLARKLTIALGVVTCGWLVILVVWGPAPFAASFDDAYYYFTIGRNWAQGHASTFDGIDRTNGYHPLWQLVAILPYLVGLDGFAAVRTLLVVQLALWAGAMWLVARAVAAAVGGWPRLADDARARRFCDGAVVVGFVALCANPFIFKMTVNGLESGLVVPVGAALITVTIRFRGGFISRATRGQRFASGALLALAFVARTDAVILLAAVLVWCLVDAARPHLARARKLGRLTELFAIPVIVVVAYLVTNQAFFDTPLQISGTVKRLPLTPTRVIVTVVWVLVGVAVIVGTRRPISTASRLRRTRRFLAVTGWYTTFCVGLVGYYSTLQEVPYLWYFAPLALDGTFLVMLLVADLAEGAILDNVGHTGRRAWLSARIPALILLVPLLAALGWSIPGYVDPGARALMVHDAAAGRWIDHHLPPDARIASWDAGVIGYFAHRHVVNLDGVVNSHAWYEASRHGATGAFLTRRDVEWVANHGGDVNGRDPDIDRQIQALFDARRLGAIRVVYRTTYDYTGTIDGSRTDTSTKKMGTYVYRIDR